MPADVLIPIADGVKDSTAATLMMKGMTARCLFRQVRPLVAGKTILYHAAAGGVGTIASQIARAPPRRRRPPPPWPRPAVRTPRKLKTPSVIQSDTIAR